MQINVREIKKRKCAHVQVRLVQIFVALRLMHLKVQRHLI